MNTELINNLLELKKEGLRSLLTQVTEDGPTDQNLIVKANQMKRDIDGLKLALSESPDALKAKVHEHKEKMVNLIWETPTGCHDVFYKLIDEVHVFEFAIRIQTMPDKKEVMTPVEQN